MQNDKYLSSIGYCSPDRNFPEKEATRLPVLGKLTPTTFSMLTGTASAPHRCGAHEAVRIGAESAPVSQAFS